MVVKIVSKGLNVRDGVLSSLARQMARKEDCIVSDTADIAWSSLIELFLPNVT